MSFILDALKKSESERRLGQTPSLQDANQSTASTKARSQWLLPMLAVLVVAAVVGWGWNQFGGVEPAALSSETNVVVADAVGEKAVLVEEISEYRSPAAIASMKANSQSPISSYTPPATGVKSSNGMDLPETGKIISITPSEGSSTDLGQAKTTATEQPHLNDADQQAQRLQRLRQQRQAERAEDEALVAAVETRLAAEAASVTTDNSIRFRELSASVRSSMPDIKVTTQVYAVEPENRFAIINGKRFREAEIVSDGVILDEILRRGVIVKYKQYRVLIGD